MILRYLALLFCCLFTLAFLKPTSIFATTYYFQDEFNQERSSNALDLSKWTIYKNASAGITTIQESEGNMQMSQQKNTQQFPLIISKNALPDGDFIAEIRLQFTNITYWGTGIALSEQAPTNGGGFNKVLTMNIWQDKSVGPNMRISFGNDISLLSNIVYTAPINTNQHTLSVERKLNNYLIYLDSRLVYTSPTTDQQLKYIWMGNPSVQNPPIPDWSSFKVDYVRVAALPAPFLDLPWGYQGKGLDFNEAALSINSFFDHQYPLLSRGRDLPEPSTAIPTIVDYLGRTTNNNYTKHDGYDWGNSAKANLSDPVLAAAPGSATYINSCSSCGNMLVIDHGNGYQTRYMHLLKDGLITNIPNQPVPVNDRQLIGKVGFTGNVWPNDERGAHIHFGVFQDKNGDGNFNDNEPDGVTDPFGWQSDSTDPWESYTFDYLGQNRTGNKSYYLWKNNLANMAQTVTPSGSTTNVGNFTLTLPPNATDKNIVINAKSAPVVQPSNSLISVGSTLFIKATDILGNPVTQLQNLYDLVLDFSNLDISKLKTDSLSFYSSSDGISWTKEDTTFPGPTAARTQLNHFSYFALLGDRVDTTAPTTTAILSGTEGQPGWFRSDVSLTLNAVDNEGGLGVNYAVYRVNEDDMQLYNSPINFANEGHYKVEFYSVDEDENIEELKSVEFDIDEMAPTVTLDVNPKIIWPPNGKKVNITVGGSLIEENPLNATFNFIDEYGLIQPIITNFGQTIQLEAKRKGDDLDGRIYTIEVTAEDKAGNTTTEQTHILVPHDQSKN